LVRGFNMTLFLMLGNTINPRFGAPKCSQREGDKHVYLCSILDKHV
jgi:hypothetical protein